METRRYNMCHSYHRSLVRRRLVVWFRVLPRSFRRWGRFLIRAGSVLVLFRRCSGRIVFSAPLDENVALVPVIGQ